MKKVILIGGPPTVGKSYTANKIAKELKLSWISTDTIRGQMRKIVRKEDYPKLFLHENANSNMAIEFLSKKSPKEIVQHQNDESEEVWAGVKALIETDYPWDSFIIEGIAILPHLIKNLKSHKEVKVLFLVDENKERIRKTIFTRGLWDDADKYPDSVKEKEVDWVVEFNKYIKEEAKKYNLPIVEIKDQKGYLKEVKKLIK
ncbi:2-phosphoglycerate kinase [uncultured archaeon]|nr:2-phosphoglycerate kinase [uncultured archaeon]